MRGLTKSVFALWCESGHQKLLEKYVWVYSVFASAMDLLANLHE